MHQKAKSHRQIKLRLYIIGQEYDLSKIIHNKGNDCRIKCESIDKIFDYLKTIFFTFIRKIVNANIKL